MTDTAPVAPAEPAETAGAATTPTRPRWPDQLVNASGFVAWASLVLIAAGVVFGLVPVRNPKVQDCGTPFAFIVTGRVDGFVDPTHPPRGMTSKEAEAANRRPCRKRVAPRMVRSGEFLLGGLVVGVAGAAMLMIGRSARKRALLREFRAGLPL